MDSYNIDSHKIHYHPERLAAWQRGEIVAPIYLEISPSGACNCRCKFCGMDFIGYKKRFWDTDLLKGRVARMGALGLKSIMYAGEGEPFLHPELADIIVHTQERGVDVAITTNAIVMQPAISEQILGHVSWIKASVNAGSSETYATVHGVDGKKFSDAIKNLEQAAQIRSRKGHRCTLGMQMVLLPENVQEAVPLAEMAKNIGMDYLVIKPYSQHPLSGNRDYEGLRYSDLLEMEERLAALNTERFKVIFRSATMRKLEAEERSFKHCLGLPFAGYVDTGGDMWGCLAYISDKRFYFGNIITEDPEEVFYGKRRAEALRWAATDLDVQQCRTNCRLDAVNTFLGQLDNPHHHVNFI
ncbi:MAG: radical SAM protein [Proteobacteria bacterium]|nr:radical SAM protein [Pseudomonadota bacterium]